MLGPKILIGGFVPDTGTNFDWRVGAQCWYLKFQLVDLCLILEPKTLIGVFVPDAGT